MRITVAILVAFFVSALTFSVSHAEEEPLRLSVLTGRIIFDKSAEDFNVTQNVAINVSGSQTGRLRISMQDLVVTTEGATITLPYGSTDTSLSGVIAISPQNIDYRPNETGALQQFNVNLTVDPEKITKPLQGEFLVKLTPTNEDGSEGFSVNQALAIAYTAVAVPTPGDLRLYDLRIRNESLTVSKFQVAGYLDRVIPDIPRVINSGPVTMEHRSQNIGDILLDKRAVFKIYRVSPLSVFSDEERDPFYTINGEPRLVLAGANFVSGYSSLIKVENGTDIDALPFIGIIKFEATAVGEISGVAAQLENQPIVKYYVVFPWKWTLVILISLALYSYFRFGRRKKSRVFDDGDTMEIEKITQNSSSKLALQFRTREPMQIKLPKKAAAIKPAKKTAKPVKKKPAVKKISKATKKKTVAKRVDKPLKKKSAVKKISKATKKKPSARKPVRSTEENKFVISIK